MMTIPLCKEIETATFKATPCSSDNSPCRRVAQEAALRLDRAESRSRVAEERVTHLERQLEEALTGRRTLEKESATAKAKATACQRSLDTRTAEWEEARANHREQLERKAVELERTQAALQRRTVELESAKKELSTRDEKSAAAERRAVEKVASIADDLRGTKDHLSTAERSLSRLQGENADLRGRHAALLRDATSLREALSAAQTDRRILKERQSSTSECKAIHTIDTTTPMMTDLIRCCAKAEAAEIATLLSQNEKLQTLLCTEQTNSLRLREKAQRKLDAAAAEMNVLKCKLETRERQLSAAQEAVKSAEIERQSCGSQAERESAIFSSRIKSLEKEVQVEKKKVTQAKEEAQELAQERLEMELSGQALKFERRIQELELQIAHWHTAQECSSAGIPPNSSLLDYIPRAEASRMLETRLAAREAEYTAAASSRLAASEREWMWRFEAKETEIISAGEKIISLENKLQAEQGRALASISALELEKNKYSEDCDKLRDLCSDLKLAVDQAREEIWTLQLEAEKQEKQSMESERLHRREYASMEDRLLTADDQIKSLKSRVLTVQKKYEACICDKQRLQEERDALASEVLITSEKALTEKAQRTALDNQVSELRQSIAELINCRTALQKQLDGKEEQAARTEKQLEATLQAAAATREEYKRAAETAQSRDMEWKHRLSNLQRAYQEKERECKILHEAKELQGISLTDANNVAAELSQRLAAEQTKVRQLEDGHKTKINQIELLAEQRAIRDAEDRARGETNAAAMAAAQERRLRDAAIAPLEAEVTRLRARLAEIQASHASDLAALEMSARRQVEVAKQKARDTIQSLQLESSSPLESLGLTHSDMITDH